MNAYETKLKYQRDLKNVIDTAFEEGKREGKRTVASAILAEGVSTEYGMRMTGLS